MSLAEKTKNRKKKKHERQYDGETCLLIVIAARGTNMSFRPNNVGLHKPTYAFFYLYLYHPFRCIMLGLAYYFSPRA
jgi:hypothetical protein